MSRPPFRLFPPVASLLAMSLLTLASCAVAPKQVTLFVGPNVAADTVGQGVQVALAVTDRREAMPPRDNALPAKITSKPEAVLDEQVKRILIKKGFTVSERPTGGAALIVTIKRLAYSTPAKSSQGMETANVELIFSARLNRHVLTRTYRVNYERQVVLTPFADLSGHLLNQALTAALESFAKDAPMFSLLAGQPLDVQ